MSAWDDYVEWSGLDESMLAHPAGKALESPEVAEARMDEQACALASSNAPRRPRLPDWLGGFLLGLFVHLVVVGIGVAGAMAAGWTL